MSCLGTDLDGLAQAFDRAINRGFSIGAPLAKSAVDVALNDLLGRALGVPSARCGVSGAGTAASWPGSLPARARTAPQRR